MSTRRQFIITPSLARLIQGEKEGSHVLEGYFPDREPRSLSVQIADDRGCLILTDSSEGSAEERMDIPLAHAEALLAATAGQVEYTRTTLAISSHEIHIQHFISPGPLNLVTVEVNEGAQEFQPLPWFGPDVSGDPAYLRRMLVLNGPPPVPEVELTDRALNSLLDVLENKFASWPSPQDPVVPEGMIPDQSAEPTASADEDEEVDDLGIEDDVIRELARSLRPPRT